MTIYCATSNAGKLREFRLAAERCQASDIRIEPLPGLENIPPPVEAGQTFEDNAVAKAVYYSKFVGLPVFAEDSGLEVEALGGRPGVFSARYAGPAATDEENNRRLLHELRGVADRRARFVSVIALACRGRLLGTFRGEVEGVIAEEPRGHHGFGYDPIFYYPPYGCTLAEATPEQKLQVSHRGRAFEKLLRYLLAHPWEIEGEEGGPEEGRECGR